MTNNVVTGLLPRPQSSVGNGKESLTRVYRELAAKALQLTQWPNSTNANILFPRDNTGTYLVPEFPESEAPIALAAILERNKGSLPIIQECNHVFDAFVDELIHALASTFCSGQNYIENRNQIKEELERYTWRIPAGTHHVTVAVFQENPSILVDQADKERWKRVEERQALEVFCRISSYFQDASSKVSCPILELDSILLTEDGAMIAGFVDTADTFHWIRARCCDIAATILGDLTSRPKSLIHVTIGRVHALPNKLNTNQQQAVTDLVRRYNTKILPKKVADMLQCLPNKATFQLTELTMLRDIVWKLRRYKEYGSLYLKPSRRIS